MKKNNKFTKLEKINIKQQQSISLEILKDVASFCDSNNITYYLACGTLLGAIRHNGFIPWDDDIDIMMPRPDYIKFNKTYFSYKYRINRPLDEGRYYYSKVYDPLTIKYEKDIDYKKFDPLGVDIDIFPLDGICNDKIKIEKIYKIECFLESLLRLSRQPIFNRKKIINAIYRIITRILGGKNIVKLIEKNAARYSFYESDFIVRMRWSPNGFTGALPKEVYKIDKHIFENEKFNIPKGYDVWLKSFFGDYMKLPKEEKRVAHNNECYFIKNL